MHCFSISEGCPTTAERPDFSSSDVATSLVDRGQGYRTPTLNTIHCYNNGPQINAYLNLPNGPDTNSVRAYDHGFNVDVGSR